MAEMVFSVYSPFFEHVVCVHIPSLLASFVYSVAEMVFSVSKLALFKQIAELKEELQSEEESLSKKLDSISTLIRKYNDIAIYNFRLVLCCSQAVVEVSLTKPLWYLNVFHFHLPTGPIKPEFGSLDFEPGPISMLTQEKGLQLIDEYDPAHSHLELVFERLYVTELPGIDGILQHCARLERIQAVIDHTSSAIAGHMEDLAKSSILIALYPAHVPIFSELVTLGFKGTVYVPYRRWLKSQYDLADGIIARVMEWSCYREFLGLDDMLNQMDCFRMIQLAISSTTSEIARLQQELNGVSN
ncbi:hypothetical protein OROMI_017168 [Orobanche minor]